MYQIKYEDKNGNIQTINVKTLESARVIWADILPNVKRMLSDKPQAAKKLTFWDVLGACVMGAILGAFLAYNLLGGF